MRQAKHNPLTFYLRTLLYAFIALFLRLVALAPLAALFVFPSESPWRYLALLCPVMIVFGVLPLRYSFAEALNWHTGRRYFSYDTALGFGRYWEKLMESVLHMLSLLKWAVPMLALGVYAWYLKDNVNLRILFDALNDIGRNAGNIWYGFANFFITIFGQPAIKPVAASMMQGVYVVAGVVGLAALIFIYGALRNSCNRYIWVIAAREERPTRREIRRRMHGRRWRQLLAGLCNLVLWAPFLMVIALCLRDVLGQTSTQLMMMVGYNGGSGLDVAGALMPIIAAFLLLYMPLLPARRMITAAFAGRDLRRVTPPAAEPDRRSVQAEEPEAMPAAIVPDWVRAANDGQEQAEEIETAGNTVPEAEQIEACSVSASGEDSGADLNV